MENELNNSLWAIYYESEAYSVSGERIMGRQAAGNALLRAYARSSYKNIAVYTKDKNSVESFANSFKQLLPKGNSKNIVHIPFSNPIKSEIFGGIYYPAPDITKLSNQRFFYGHNNYSLVGITHTTASEGVINSLIENYTAPLMEWDAIICTSNSVKNSIDTLYDQNFEMLKDKIGASKKPNFQLPVIPLGVHVDDYNFDDNDRNTSRKNLGIQEDDIVLLFLGRLSFHAKAHHVPMYLALEEVAKKVSKKKKIHLIQTGWFPNPSVEKIFKDDAKSLAPSVIFHYLDGRKDVDKKNSYAASDIFISLVDNFQETFGLTPLEGMASNLPVIVSDWNGYKDTVRDTIDGFRIKSSTMPPGNGYNMALRHNLGIDNYDHYIGRTSQTVSLDINETIEKIILLIENENLRKEIGNNAKKRAKDFDWLQVLKLYNDLKEELNKKRQLFVKEKNKTFLPPVNIQDQYTFFSDYASLRINYETEIVSVKVINNFNIREFSQFGSISFLNDILPPIDLLERTFDYINDKNECKISDIVNILGVSDTMTYKVVLWLAKYGYLRIKS
tara:strand:+ start:1709 stop:3382 length:1674 start_codon:yes stop_codon:yes gene_type:complete